MRGRIGNDAIGRAAYLADSQFEPGNGEALYERAVAQTRHMQWMRRLAFCFISCPTGGAPLMCSVMLHRKSILLLLGALGVLVLAFAFVAVAGRGVGLRHSFGLNTPYGRFGFQEYDWHRAHASRGLSRLTIERYREQIRERFILQTQPKSRYTTIIFLGSHTYRIDRSLRAVLGVGFGALCVLVLLASATLKMCHALWDRDITPA